MEYSIEEELEEQMKINKDLQKKINKAIGMIGLIIRDIEENNIPPKRQDLDEILSNLQGKEVK